MATPGSIELFVSQGPNATERYSVRMDPDLPAGSTVSASGHETHHTPPSGGTAITPTVEVAGNTVTITVANLVTVGLHKVEADIDYDNSGGISQGIILWITVP